MPHATHEFAVPGGVLRTSWDGDSDRGSVRALNEDSFIAWPTVWVVADGMGGHEHGERASGAAVDAFAALGRDGCPADPQTVLATIRAANHRVLELPGDGLSGTTLTGIALVTLEGGALAWMAFNVGDSRTYRVRKGRLEQVSVDHSAVQELVDVGAITPEEAELHPDRNVITRALGAGADVQADVWIMPARTSERFLLCSDGLTRELPDDELERIIAFYDEEAARHTGPMQTLAERLVSAAVAAGGRDNVTAVIVDVRFASNDAASAEETIDRLPGVLEDTRPRS
jgi:serine/threonine protein phosphatase PrpC